MKLLRYSEGDLIREGFWGWPRRTEEPPAKAEPSHMGGHTELVRTSDRKKAPRALRRYSFPRSATAFAFYHCLVDKSKSSPRRLPRGSRQPAGGWRWEDTRTTQR